MTSIIDSNLGLHIVKILSNLGLHIVKILSCSYFELQLFLSNFWYSNGKMRSSSF